MQHRFDMDGGKRKLTELIAESNELNDSEEPKKKITPIYDSSLLIAYLFSLFLLLSFIIKHQEVSK